MNSQRCCLAVGIGILLVGALIALGLFGIRLLGQRQVRARMDYLPPSIQITSPQNGVNAPVGSYLSVISATTFSPQSPVETIEWWLDGIRMESHSLRTGSGSSQAFDTYSLPVPTEGTHMLLARAINTRGVIATSQPLTFQGEAKGKVLLSVVVAEGETLEDLAAQHGTDPATLQGLNPGLGSAPAPGTTLIAPAPAEMETPSAPPALPPAGGVTLVPAAPMLQVAAPASENWANLLLAAPPQAPANLQGEVKDCRVRLLWEDHATNESGYEIWMAAPGAPLKRMVTLQPAPGGTTWFEFNAPGPGYFIFWVEAVNSLGRQGSNVIYLHLDAGCPAGAVTHLQVEILDLTTSGVERAYCYISFDHAPEVRLPVGNGNFIAVQNGHGDLTAWPHGFALSIPQDNVLDLSGECWGWAGQNLRNLGTFIAKLGSESWDGAPRLVQGGSFAVGLSILPQGTDQTMTTYANNGGIPEPYNLRLEREEGPNCKPACWVLHWDFNPSPDKDSDFEFNIHWTEEKDPSVEHKLGWYFAGHSRAIVLDYTGTQEFLYQYFGCDKYILFDVAADNRTGTHYVHAVTHGVLRYLLPKCPSSLTVTFDALELPWTGDGWDPGPCDEIEAYYTLMVNDRRKDFWGGCSFGSGCFVQSLRCGTHTFKQLASPTSDPYADRITVSNYTEPVKLKIATLFYDYDDNADDVFAPFVLEHTWPTRAAAEAELGCKGKSFITDKHVNDTADSILHYTISIFPNPCQPSQP